jgi:hypothetical protein
MPRVAHADEVTDWNAVLIRATDVQATWTPLIVTPPYPDYDSGHQSVSGSAQAILTAFFGSMPVQGTSEGLAGVVRSWPREMHEPARSTLRRTCTSTLPSE